MKTVTIRMNTGCVTMTILIVVTPVLVCLLNRFPSNYQRSVSREFTPPAFKQWNHIFHHSLTTPRQDTQYNSDQFEDHKDLCHILHHSNSCNKVPNFFMYQERREEFRDVVVNYMHVPKSGGTTMKECMKAIAKRRHMTSPVLLHTDGRVEWTESILNDDDIGLMSDVPLFMGDYSFGFCDVIHEKFDKKCSEFIMLREPFDRLVSHYFYCIQLNQTVEGIPDCSTHPIKEWAMSTKSVLWNQFFTDTSCSRLVKDGKWQCKVDYNAVPNAFKLSENVSYVKSVVASLDKHFSVIGLTEDYPNSLRMLQMAYNLPFYDVCGRINYNKGTYKMVDQNRTYLNKEQRKNIARLSLTEDDEIRNLLYPELEIYKRAKEIFKTQLREMDRIKKLQEKPP